MLGDKGSLTLFLTRGGIDTCSEGQEMLAEGQGWQSEAGSARGITDDGGILDVGGGGGTRLMVAA